MSTYKLQIYFWSRLYFIQLALCWRPFITKSNCEYSSRYAPEARLEVNYFSWFFQASTPSLSPSASPSLSSGHSRKNPPPPPVSKPPGPPGGGGPGRPNMKPPPPPPVGQPPSGGPPPPPSSHYSSRGMLGTTRSLPIGHFHKWRKTIIQGHKHPKPGLYF